MENDQDPIVTHSFPISSIKMVPKEKPTEAERFKRVQKNRLRQGGEMDRVAIDQYLALDVQLVANLAAASPKGTIQDAVEDSITLVLEAASRVRSEREKVLSRLSYLSLYELAEILGVDWSAIANAPDLKLAKLDPIKGPVQLEIQRFVNDRDCELYDLAVVLSQEVSYIEESDVAIDATAVIAKIANIVNIAAKTANGVATEMAAIAAIALNDEAALNALNAVMAEIVQSDKTVEIDEIDEIVKIDQIDAPAAIAAITAIAAIAQIAATALTGAIAAIAATAENAKNAATAKIAVVKPMPFGAITCLEALRYAVEIGDASDESLKGSFKKFLMKPPEDAAFWVATWVKQPVDWKTPKLEFSVVEFLAGLINHFGPYWQKSQEIAPGQREKANRTNEKTKIKRWTARTKGLIDFAKRKGKPKSKKREDIVEWLWEFANESGKELEMSRVKEPVVDVFRVLLLQPNVLDVDLAKCQEFRSEGLDQIIIGDMRELLRKGGLLPPAKKK